MQVSTLEAALGALKEDKFQSEAKLRLKLEKTLREYSVTLEEKDRLRFNVQSYQGRVTTLESSNQALDTKLRHLASSKQELLDSKSVLEERMIGEVVDAAGSSLQQFSYASCSGEAPFAPFVSDVAKNLTALHGVLAKQLPPSQLEEVCGDIFSLLSVRLPLLFRPAIPSSSEAKERLVEDLNFLRRAAKELDGAAAEKLRLDAFVAEVREGAG